MQVLSAPIALAVDAVSFIVSALFLTRVKADEPPVEPIPRVSASDLQRGYGLPARPDHPAGALAAATINFFNFAFSAVFVLYATRYLGVTPGTLGLALGVGAIGGLIGAVIAGPIGRRSVSGRRLHSDASCSRRH